MITFGKTSSKPNFLFGKLPKYFKEHDSYKDGNGEGLLERFLELFCTELDQEFSPYVDDVLDITNVEQLSSLNISNPTDFLNILSDIFSNPPDIGTGQNYSGGEDEYIKLIRYIIWILKTRGTIKSLQLFLALYKYEISSITSVTQTGKVYDDSPVGVYDNSNKYDSSGLFYSGYNLVITDYQGTTTKSPPQAWLDDYLKPAIQKFINPIWAELISISYT